MPRRHPLPPAAALLAATLLLAACGSRVPEGVTVADGSGSGPGSAADQELGAAAPGAAGSTSGTAGSTVSGPGVGAAGGSFGAAPGAPAGSGTTATGGTAPDAAATGSLPPTGFGYDRKYVYIGVITQKDAERVFSSFGAKNVDPGDTEAQASAVAADINAHAGVFGRQVKLVFKDVATIDTAQNPTTTGAAVCTYFAEDHPVIAVMSVVTVLDYPPFRACMAKNKIPLFSATVKVVDDRASAALAPYFYQSIAVSWDGLGPVLAQRLKAQGWFSGWDVRTGAPGTAPPVVGVVVDGTDIGARIGAMLKRNLLAAGAKDVVVYRYAQASDGQSASVQYFQQNGVTHVIVTDVELTAFQNAAASQQYKPRYGISSYNDPYTNLEAGGLTPTGANNGSMGVGYAPPLDVGDANDPGTTPGARNCLAVMQKNGQTFTGKRLARVYAFSMCDSILLAARGAVEGGGLTGVEIARGIATLAPTYSPAIGFTTGLTATHHYVPGQARDLAWNTECACFRYGAGRAAL